MFRGLLKIGVSTMRQFLCDLEPLSAQFSRLTCSPLTPNSLLLDVGCGTECRAQAQGKCKLVIGIDREVTIPATIGVDSRVVGDLAFLPFRENVFSVITCFDVVEHLENPGACFYELHRVCKSNGLVVVTTPNLWHYEILIIKLTPYWFHKWFIHAILAGSGDSYPTKYLSNTRRRLIRLMKAAGFEPVELKSLDFGPRFLDWFAPAYALGVIYHRLLNRFSELSFLRGVILGVFRKQ